MEDAAQTCSVASVKTAHLVEDRLIGGMIVSADSRLLHHHEEEILRSSADPPQDAQTEAATSHFLEHVMYVANGDIGLTIVLQEVEAGAVAGEDEAKNLANPAILHIEERLVPSIAPNLFTQFFHSVGFKLKTAQLPLYDQWGGSR
jgi:hypothetical protein